MTKSKSTKRAFVVSLLALTLCFAMLVGTTWAWFTDTVTSGRNRIYGGYLDVELVHVVTDATTAAPSDEAVTETTVLFDDVEKWEPGVISYETFKVKNVGDVALKYSFNVSDIAKNTITKDGATHDLTEVIKVAVTDTVPADRTAAQALTYVPLDQLIAQEGHLAVGAESPATTVVLYWEPTDHDDDYNRKNTGWTLSDGDHLYIDFGVTLVATQDTVEEDSFDNQYDADALYPNVAKVSTAADLAAALNDPEIDKVILDADIANTFAVPAGQTKELDLNGKTIGGIDAYGNVTIENGNVSGSVYANDDAHVVVAADATLQNMYSVILWNDADNAVVDIYGTLEGNFWVMGNIQDSNSVVNVYGKIEGGAGSDVGLALNGDATVNVYDGAEITSETGIEVRAGNLNVYGGTITGTGVPVNVLPNGSGTTTTGAGIAVAQHTTKLPINVNITGGTISGYSALYESNPQNNADADLDKITINVTGGTFSTINGGTVKYSIADEAKIHYTNTVG